MVIIESAFCSFLFYSPYSLCLNGEPKLWYLNPISGKKTTMFA